MPSKGKNRTVHHENSLHAGDESCKRGIHFDFETQGRLYQKCKTGYQWSHKRANILQFILKKIKALAKRNILKSIRQNQASDQKANSYVLPLQWRHDVNIKSIKRAFSRTKTSSLNALKSHFLMYISRPVCDKIAIFSGILAIWSYQVSEWNEFLMKFFSKTAWSSAIQQNTSA